MAEDSLKKLIEQRDAERLLLLRKAYEITGGIAAKHSLNGVEMGKAVGLAKEATRAAIDYLCAKGLFKRIGAGMSVAITHEGCWEVENSAKKPSVGTEHFSPAVIQLTQNFHAPVAAVQTGDLNTTTATPAASPEQAELRRLLAELRARPAQSTALENEAALTKQDEQLLKAIFSVMGIKDGHDHLTSLAIILKAMSKL